MHNKHKTLKKLFAVMLCSVLTVSTAAVLPDVMPESSITANAAVNSSDWLYTVSGRTVIINGYSGSGGSVSVPDTLSSLPVTEISDNAFMNCKTITSITLPDSIKSIGTKAFANCSELNSVYLSGSVSSIGKLAFYNCEKLSYISVESANQYFSSLNGVLFDKQKTTLIQCPQKRSGSYTIPDGVTAIEDRAFENCRSITEIIIPKGVKSIGYASFSNTGIKSITLPDTLAKIGSRAFKSCASLLSINIPNSVTSIGSAAFMNCYSIRNITIPGSVKSISDHVFYDCEGLSSVTIKSGITAIESDSFGFCSSLKNIVIPGTVNAIGDRAFSDCGLISDVTIPESVKSIGVRAFANCSSLKSITIPKSVTIINQKAFGYYWNYDSETAKAVSGFTIKGISGSAAQKYSSSNNITFIPLKVDAEKVTLSQTSATIDKGKTLTLTATVYPEETTNKSLTWTSSNSSVASVSNGNITAAAAGTAIITAKTSNGKTASCVVTVKEPVIYASSIKLDKTATGLGVGETITLKATVSPSNAVLTWKSSNPSVVTVTNGKIKGIKPGTATITASSGYVRMTCSVSVKAAPTSAALSKNAVTIGVGEKFSVNTILPANTAAVTRIYSSSNSSVARMTKTTWIGEFIGVKPGTANVTVRLYNGKTAKCIVNVKPAPSSVSLTKTSMSMGVGETFSISAVLPANTASASRTYTSNNPSVVQMTRSDWMGKFKALKTGTAKITVRLYNGKTAVCTVYVNPAPAYVKMSKTSMTIKVGQTASVSAILSPGASAATRTYSTNDPSVIKMTRTDWTGTFKGLKPGTAYVTVKTYNGKTACCKVTVEK